MYYRGDDLIKALPEAWLRDERSRTHSNLLLLASGEEPVSFIWSPENRPFGYPLEYCSCEHWHCAKWRHELTTKNAERTMCQYECLKCSAKLRVWFCSEQDLTCSHLAGTSYIRSSWPAPDLHLSIELSGAKAGSGVKPMA